MDSISRKFIPVQGTELEIMSKGYHEGHLYFSTDTKKIYLDANGISKMPMGGNSGIHYGNMQLQETPDEGQKEFEFSIYDIEGNQDDPDVLTIPNINDLILNIPDGSFYRVVEKLDEETLLTHRLTIAGSGGSGGGGGTGTAGSATMDRLGNQYVTSLYQKECIIGFKLTAVDSSGESTGNGKYDLFIGGVKKASGTAYQGENYLDIGPYLSLGENEVKVSAYMDTGGSSATTVSKKWTATTTRMELSWNYDSATINNINSIVRLSWSVSGRDLTKVTHIIIDDYYEVDPISSTTTSIQTYDLRASEFNLGHGAHKVEIYATTSIGGEDIRTDSIIKNVIFVDENDTTPIISCDFFNTNITQYNTIQIPVIIYATTNTAGNAVVYLKENGSEKDKWEGVKNSEVNYWAYTPTLAGDIVLTIQCGVSEKVLNVYSIALDIDNDEIIDYTFKLKASDFASNNAIQNWNSNGVTASFSEKFDWINGGLKTETLSDGSSRQYICVKAGSTMYINYDPFNIDARGSGKNLKIIFKATKCKEYDAQVLSCTDGTRGLIMDAQSSTYYSTSTQTKTQYCEDEYIEYEIDITPTTAPLTYIQPWLDGIPAGITLYASDDLFKTSGENKIVIGSNDCDVYIYLIKLYERTLSRDEHLQNFIADAPNAEEMVARFRRNDILDDEREGEVSPTKLAAANPNCLVHLYDIERMTLNKKDSIKNCKYIQYHGSTSPVLTCDNATIKVQGTSSAAYGLAAFNLDSDFSIQDDGTGGFKDANGELLVYKNANNEVIEEYTGKWAMTEQSIPNDFFCTKVNVASCEGANNALNQEWYNRFQPYPTLARLKNTKARDTMEFTPGVLFIKDNNKEVAHPTDNKANNVFKEIEGYVEDPYHKLYSVCNMGNSKDNITILHDTTNPLECCIENGDNQLPGQWMTIPQGGYEGADGEFVAVDLININSGESTLCPDGVYRDNRILWENGMDEVYGFRYPDGIDTVKEDHPEQAESMIKGWFDFVEWMAKSNPQEKYKEVEYVNAEAFAADPSKKYTFDNDYHHEVESDATFDENEKYYIETVHVYGATNEKLDTPAVFGAYTFKGYIADATLQKNYTPVVKGCQVATYAGTYTHDTTEYRMAKMLSECEDHLVMDSILFHYLFIERHSMVDNVAKNTFWSTEDGQHWNLTKDYDNDTADGNNNQGYLALTYGYEPGDVDSEGTSIFNAGNSVWMYFVRNLYPALQKVYTELDSRGAWSPTAYLKLFKEWQAAIPERCWIEDYYRKYIRPYEIYKDTMFLGMLEGGKKTHQRAQFETYQNQYISSKYFGSDCKNSRFVMRINAEVEAGADTLPPFPVRLYSDCYIKGCFGSGTENPNYSRRSKRGEIIYVAVPLKNATDATSYLHPASQFSFLGHPDFGSLGHLKLEQMTTEGAKKLRILAMGLYDDDKSLEDQITYEGLSDIAFDSNELLEELYVANYTTIHSGTTPYLNLSAAPNLKVLDVRGSTFTGVTIADNAATEIIKVNKPATLVLSNLKELLTLDIQNPLTLTQLSLNNIDNSQINSKDILDLANNLESYRLLNIQWDLNNSTDISSSNNTIPVLERLLALEPYTTDKGETLSTQDSLTGTITISEEAYNGEDSFAIYNKYAQSDIYPNVNIVFEGENAKLYTITILNGDGEIYWQRKIEPGANVTEDFLADGPNDTFNPAGIIKPDSLQNSYTRKVGYWNVYEGDSTEYTEQNLGESPLYTNVTCDLTFEPVFEETVRVYTLEFYESSSDLDPIATKTAPYGTPLADILPAVVPYKAPGANFDLYEAYSFIGYGLTPTTENPVSSEYKVTVNQKFYAIFEKVNDVRTIVHPEYFEALDFITATLGGDTYVDKYLNPANGTPTKVRETPGVALRPKVHLKGKVTIPSTFEGKPVYGLVDFYKPSSVNRVTELTHVFMEKEGSTLYAIGQNAFSSSSSPFDNGLSNLMYFDFSRDTIEYVGYQAFTGASFKEMIGNTTLAKELNLSVQNTEYANSYVRLSANLYYVNQQAFAGIFKDKTISKNVTLFVPDTVNYLQGQAPFGLMFYYGNNISNLTFVLGDIDHCVYTYSSGLCDIRFGEGATYTSDGKVYPKFAQNQGYVPVTNIDGVDISNYTVLLRNVAGYSPDTVIEDANDPNKSFFLLDLFQTEGASGLSTAQVTLQIQ